MAADGDLRFTGGPNVAVKIPKADYEATVDYYRTTLDLEVREVQDTGSPVVARSHVVDFGPIQLWLDQVDTAARSDVWLEVQTNDLEAARVRLGEAGTHPRDEVEPLDGARAHWMRDPAGVVHLLREEPPSPA